MNEITTLAGATVTTVTLAISALIIGLVLAMLFTAWESAKWKAFAFLGTCWVTLIRGLPEMLVVLFVYYGTLQGVMMLMDGIELGPFTLQFDFGDTESLPFYCGVIALSLLYASYASQTLRGALKAVPTGQWEAGQALGMGKITIFSALSCLKCGVTRYPDSVISG